MDSIQLLLREVGPLPAAAPRGGDRARQAHRARRPGGEGPDDQLQPPARRVDRAPLPGPGPAVRRPRPGGHARPHPRRREVRLAQGLPLLHLRDAVDPAGDPARPGEHVAHHPAPRPRRAARAQGRPDRARAGDEARPRADATRRSPWPPSCRSRRSSRSARPSAPSRRSTSPSARTATRRSATCSPLRRPPSTRRSRRACSPRSCSARSPTCPTPSAT